MKKSIDISFPWDKMMSCEWDPSNSLSEAVSLHLKYRNKYMSLQSEKDSRVLWVLPSPGKPAFQSVLPWIFTQREKTPRGELKRDSTENALFGIKHQKGIYVLLIAVKSLQYIGFREEANQRSSHALFFPFSFSPTFTHPQVWGNVTVRPHCYKTVN